MAVDSGERDALALEREKLIRQASEHPGVAEYLRLLEEISASNEQILEIEQFQALPALPISSTSTCPDFGG